MFTSKDIVLKIKDILNDPDSTELPDLVREGKLSEAKELLDAGVDIETKDVCDCTALFNAMNRYSSHFLNDNDKKELLDFIHLLIEKGADVNVINSYNTALVKHAAAAAQKYGDIDLLKKLKEHGLTADSINQIDDWGTNSLSYLKDGLVKSYLISLGGINLTKDEIQNRNRRMF